MRSEKVTINLSMAELGPIDYLVEKGVYVSRSDFIRLAVKKQTESHSKEMDQFISPSFLATHPEDSVRTFGGVGIIRLSQGDVDRLIQLKRKIQIRVIGVLLVDDTVTQSQIREVSAGAEVYGKIVAEPAVLAVLEGKYGTVGLTSH